MYICVCVCIFPHVLEMRVDICVCLYTHGNDVDWFASVRDGSCVRGFFIRFCFVFVNVSVCMCVCVCVGDDVYKTGIAISGRTIR